MLFSKKNSGISGFSSNNEDIVNKLYDRKNITIALASAKAFSGFGKTTDGDDLSLNSGNQELVLRGIVLEFFTKEEFIPCSITITTSPRNTQNGELGTYHLTKLDEPKNPKCMGLELEVLISVPSKEIRNSALTTIRDAALSHNQFCHFEIVTEKCDPVGAKEKFEKDGYGPYIKIIGLKMWPTVVLPKAPVWAL